MRVLVPVCGVGLGTATAEVRDVKSGRVVRIDRAQLAMIGERLYVAGNRITSETDSHLINFGGRSAWVVETVLDPSEVAA